MYDTLIFRLVTINCDLYDKRVIAVSVQPYSVLYP